MSGSPVSLTPGMAASMGVPFAPSGGGILGLLSKWWKPVALFVMLLVIVICEKYLPSYSWMVNIPLAIFGFIHLFSPGWMNKIVLGVFPWVLALASAEDIFSIPIVNWFSPAYIVLRVILMFAVLVWYYISLHVGIDYGKTLSGAGGAAYGAGSRPGFWKIVFGLAVLVLVYNLDNGGAVASWLGIGDFSHAIIGVVVFFLALLYLWRKTAISIILGIVSFILALGSAFKAGIPLDILFSFPVINLFVPGSGIVRPLLLVLVFVLYFVARRRR